MDELNALKALWADDIFDLLDSLLERDCGFEFMEDILRRKMDEFPEN